MFLSHDTEFAAFSTIDQRAVAATLAEVATATFAANTMVETQHGWRSVDRLCAGDQLATFDGGFATVRTIGASAVTDRLWLVPAGVLDTCTDLVVTEGTQIGLRRPAIMASHGAPVLLARIEALAGHRGIRPLMSRRQPLMTLGFDEEELIYAQTGALIHAGMPEGTGFFQELDYGQTRALLALGRRGPHGPDRGCH